MPPIWSKDRRSWPEAKPADRSWMWEKGFEAEDAADIPDIFRCTRQELRCPNRLSLHEIFEGCRQYGRGPLPVRDMRHMTIAERLKTFTPEWEGPPTALMAECGMVQSTSDSAQCYCCQVRFRGLTPDVCMWTRHRHLAPHCLHLQRAKTHGHRRPARRLAVQRRFSVNDSLSV